MNADSPLDLINYALSNAPSSIRILNFANLVTKVGTRMLNHKGGIRERVGRLLLTVPELVARNLKGPSDQMDVYILIHIDRATYDSAKSGIVLPKIALQ